ncbi:nitrogen-fixing NifU domain protein [Desulfovibrio sp. X2]|uniref:iron-sulfur cluster assembly scaffold protein n=1 Tax=Desulfovibrio sp. X2 TaxID=941449 RepID=UPI000358B810|nr:iron-sulfur cluster assembly scaffold protein [Desulfovibrio sp. X2]EPR43489.1 nitrogen-fixing NifU domain protein [Desulfovibrio sp. X2]
MAHEADHTTDHQPTGPSHGHGHGHAHGHSHGHHDEPDVPPLEELEHVGTMDDPDGAAETTSECGDVIGVQVRLRGNVLETVRVQPTGCAYTILCAEAVGRLCQGRTLDEVLSVEPQDVARLLGNLPDDHLHCARQALSVLGEALVRALARPRNP